MSALERISDLAASSGPSGDALLEVSESSDTVTITASTIGAEAADNSYNDSGSGFLTAGFAIGDRVVVSGFTTAANNLIVGVVTAVVAGKLTIGGPDGDGIVDEAAGDSVTISKRVSRRVTLDDIIALAPEASNSEVWAGTADDKFITPNRMVAAAVPVALVDGATITPDFNDGINFSVTLQGNRTLANPSNAQPGDSGIIVITQDATGSRTLSYGGNWHFTGGAASGGVLSTAADAVDLLTYFVLTGGTIIATLTKDIKA